MDKQDINIIGGILIGIGVLVAATISFSINQSRKECKSFGEITGRKTEFVKYAWVSYGCLTLSKDGKLIETSALREVTD